MAPSGQKWLVRNWVFMKISNKIRFFIPTSFDKFFETGKFEKKTNSVQYWELHRFSLTYTLGLNLATCLSMLCSQNEWRFLFLFFAPWIEKQSIQGVAQLSPFFLALKLLWWVHTNFFLRFLVQSKLIGKSHKKPRISIH